MSNDHVYERERRDFYQTAITSPPNRTTHTYRDSRGNILWWSRHIETRSNHKMTQQQTHYEIKQGDKETKIRALSRFIHEKLSIFGLLKMSPKIVCSSVFIMYSMQLKRSFIEGNFVNFSATRIYNPIFPHKIKFYTGFVIVILVTESRMLQKSDFFQMTLLWQWMTWFIGTLSSRLTIQIWQRTPEGGEHTTNSSTLRYDDNNTNVNKARKRLHLFTFLFTFENHYVRYCCCCCRIMRW